ncbi:MAG: DUF6691 family protein [Hyphomicrobiaceae bacterium]
MNTFTGILIGLATGVVFGFALEKSRVFEPGIIVGQMQLKTYIMLKVFLAAVVMGLVALAALNGIWGVPLQLKPLLFRADIIGGLILGVGITLAGACPGTSLAQLGAGYRDAWFVVAGGIAGAMTYGYFDAPITALFAEKGDKLSLDKLIGLPFWLTALMFAAGLVAALVALERRQPWQAEIGTDVDGMATEPSSASHSASSVDTAGRKPSAS